MIISSALKLCPDGELAGFQCNQTTRVCVEDTNLICHLIEGVYFCCGKAAETLIPLITTNVSFVPELLHQQSVPDPTDS